MYFTRSLWGNVKRWLATASLDQAVTNSSRLLNKHAKAAMHHRKATTDKKMFIYWATAASQTHSLSPEYPRQTSENSFSALDITSHCLLNRPRLVSPYVHIHGCIIAGHLGSGALRNKAWTPPLWHLRAAETALPLGEINYFSNRLFCGTLNDIRHSNPPLPTPRRLETHFPGGMPLRKRRLQKCW